MAAARSSTLARSAIIAGLLVAIVAAALLLAECGTGRESVAEQPSAAPGSVGTCGGVRASAPRELRGMYLATVYNIDFPSKPGLDEEAVKAEYRGWLDLAQRLHHNAIFVQVRPSGDAWWPSEYAPWSQWLTGRRDGVGPGWDPLAWMVAQTHARNLEFHAWFNPYRGAQPAPKGPGDDLAELAPNHPLRKHPEWAVVYPVGTKGSRFYFDPGIPEARRYIEDAILDAVTRYDIDGVDFDDFFYPYPEDGQDFGDEASFARYGKGFANKADWRRHNVNTFVREMSERIRAVKPRVAFGISPFGIWRNRATDPTGSATRGLQSYDEIYADSRTWVKQQWLDSITPQLYWQIGFDRADYAVLLRWWSTVVKGTGVQLYIAHGDYRIGESGAWRDPDELSRQITLDRTYGVDGSVHYNGTTLRQDPLGAVSRYVEKHYASPALVPALARAPARPPAAPALTSVRPAGSGAVTVTWRASEGASWYAVYRLTEGRAPLVGVVRANGGPEQSFVDKLPADGYCVSGLDRTWHEGPISQPMTPSDRG